MNNRIGTWAAVAAGVALGGATVGLAAKNALRQRQAGFTVDPSIFQKDKAFAAQPPEGGVVGATTAKTGKGGGATTQNDDDTKISYITTRLLTASHYLKKPLDETISGRLFDQYLDTLDPQHLFFLQSDLDEWAPLRTQVGRALYDKGDSSWAQVVFKRFRERYDSQVAFVGETLKTQNFTFTGDDAYSLDRKKAPRPKDLDEAKALWLQRLRFEYLTEKLNKKSPADIAKTINRRYARSARAFKDEGTDEIFELYLTTLAHAFDPHSDYFGKASTENFGISMNLSLSGIGAQLQSEDGYVKIMSLTPGGPAAKSGKLKVGDRIASVTQGAAGGEPVDVLDMNINKVVALIRGTKGTQVKLSIIPAGATDPSARKQIVLTRDDIKLEDQAAKAQIIELPDTSGRGTMRLGVIDLPSFYGGNGGRSASKDVETLLVKLKAEKVAGIVLDLRRNGGGVLGEAINISGLFIKSGPVVQVRDTGGRVTVDSDEDPKVVWDGPLVVLTSRMSASASEIVAGCLQDYGRAITVGDPSTFGKGTVQAVVDIAGILPQAGMTTVDNPGSLHLTIQQFYRPSGDSTQLKGVVSDIQIPSATMSLEYGEKYLENPLPFDHIKPAEYSKASRVTPFLAALRQKHDSRLASNPDLIYLKGEVERQHKLIAEKSISLNETTRLREKQDAEARTKARKAYLASHPSPSEKVYAITLADARKPGLPAPLDPKKAAAAGIPTTPPDEDTTPGETASAPVERDLTLDEARRILADYVALSHK